MQRTVTDSCVYPRAELLSPSGSPCDRELLIFPEAGMAPILRAFEETRRRLFVKIFELEKGRLIRALIAAHRRGVNCRVQLNRYRTDGSAMNQATFRTLRDAGVPVCWANPDVGVTHEKSIVADDTAYICTFNLSGKFFTRVRGYALVTRRMHEVDEIAACFEADWERRSFPPVGTLMWGGPASRQRILDLIDSAVSTIDVQHKKLADPLVLDRLLAALRRGVRVRFLGSGERGVHGSELHENACNLRSFASAGGEVHRLDNPKVHAKVIAVDGRSAKVGSMNLTRHCFEQRREIALIVEDEAIVGGLAGCFERDWSNSQPWSPPDHANLHPATH